MARAPATSPARLPEVMRRRRRRYALQVPVLGYHLLTYEDADLQPHVLALVRVDPTGHPVVAQLLGGGPQAARIVCYWSLLPDDSLSRLEAPLTAVVESDDVTGVFQLPFELPRDEGLFAVVAEEGRMVLALDGPERIDGELRAPLPHVSFSLSAEATADALAFARRLLGSAR